MLRLQHSSVSSYSSATPNELELTDSAEIDFHLKQACFLVSLEECFQQCVHSQMCLHESTHNPSPLGSDGALFLKKNWMIKGNLCGWDDQEEKESAQLKWEEEWFSQDVGIS